MAMNFAASIDRNIRKIAQDVNDKVYKIAIELFLTVVKNTPSPTEPGPFADGVLVNQWYPKVGGGFSDAVGTDKNSNGAASRSRITALRGGKEFLDKDGKLSLTNNVSYAYRAEVLGWPEADSPPGWNWSGKIGPYRMVARALQEITARYR